MTTEAERFAPCACSGLESSIYATEPMRERFVKLLDTKTFARLLRCSWTLYCSFAPRKSPMLVKKLQRSPQFATECLLSSHVTVAEVQAFCEMRYATAHLYHPSEINYFLLSGGRLAWDPVVVVYLHDIGTCTIKFYARGIMEPCTQSWESVAKWLESIQTCVQRSIDTIVCALQEIGVITAKLLIEYYHCDELTQFARKRRLQRFATAQHRQWLNENGFTISDDGTVSQRATECITV